MMHTSCREDRLSEGRIGRTHARNLWWTHQYCTWREILRVPSINMIIPSPFFPSGYLELEYFMDNFSSISSLGNESNLQFSCSRNNEISGFVLKVIDLEWQIFHNDHWSHPSLSIGLYPVYDLYFQTLLFLSFECLPITMPLPYPLLSIPLSSSFLLSYLISMRMTSDDNGLSPSINETRNILHDDWLTEDSSWRENPLIPFLFLLFSYLQGCFWWFHWVISTSASIWTPQLSLHQE